MIHTRSPLLIAAFLSMGIQASGMMLVLDKDSLCGNTEKVMRGSLRHIEGSGIGYDQGYTTVDLFLAPFQPIQDTWLPFIDVRGHVFNNATYAGNLGLGARILKKRVWGVNLFYDARNTKHQFFNQFGAGLEVLGNTFDFRVNGYLPFEDGDKGARFFTMGGLNVEVGWKDNKVSDMPVYLAAGPYYFHGKNKNAIGLQTRFKVDFFEYVGVEGILSYDPVFRLNVQGQFSITIPFGPRPKVKKRDQLTCRQTVLQWKTALQSISRDEIIVLDRNRSKSDQSKKEEASTKSQAVQMKLSAWKLKEEIDKNQFARIRK